MKNIVIYGCGGLGMETAQLIEDINKVNKQWNILGFIDDNEDNHGKLIMGYPIFGGQEYIVNNKIPYVTIAISNPLVRKNISLCLREICSFPILIHPSIELPKGAVVHEGCIIFKNSVISVCTSICKFSIINPMCGIGHGTTIGSYSTLMWNVIVAGDVFIMEGCSLGSHSTVLQNLICEPYSYIGAGATVTENVKYKNVVVGTPAKFLKYNR